MSSSSPTGIIDLIRAIAEDNVAKLTAVPNWTSLIGSIPCVITQMVDRQRHNCLEAVLASDAVIDVNALRMFINDAPIVDAAIRNDVVAVRTLLRHREKNVHSVEDRDAHEAEALGVACHKGYYKIVKEMLTVNGLNVNKLGGSPMMSPLLRAVLVAMTPCVHDALSIVRLLVADDRCDVNLKSGEGMTPLLYAVRYNSIDVVRELLVDRCDLSIEGPKGKTAARMASDCGALGIGILLRQLAGIKHTAAMKEEDDRDAELPPVELALNKTVNWKEGTVENEAKVPPMVKDKFPTGQAAGSHARQIEKRQRSSQSRLPSKCCRHVGLL